MEARSKKLRLLRLLGLALAAAGAVLILTWLGLLDGLEASCLDARMKHWPTNPAAASLVQLDIDDRAIEQIGRWPWPRQRLAQLVRALDQAGAGQIALDITLDNSQPVRLEEQPCEATDPNGPPGNAQAQMVLDDLDLYQAITDSGRVSLPVVIDLAGQGAGDALTARLAELAATRPAITAAQAATELCADAATVQKQLLAAKQDAFGRRLETMLRDRPLLSLPQASEALLGRSGAALDCEAISRAYLRQRALSYLRPLALDGAGLAGMPMPAGSARPPLACFAAKAIGVGVVNADEDADHVMRRCYPIFSCQAGLVGQLGLHMALHDLAKPAGQPCRLAWRDDTLDVYAGDKLVRAIPLEAGGRLRVNWPALRFSDSLRHISAVAAANCWQAQEGIEANAVLAASVLSELDELLGNREAIAQSAERATEWTYAQYQRRLFLWRLLYDPAANATSAPTALLPAAPNAAIAAALTELEQFYLAGSAATSGPATSSAPASAPAQSEPAAGAAQAQMRRLAGLLRQILAEQALLKRQLKQARAELAQHVAGRTVLVSPTATSMGDFVASPVSDKSTPCPGATLHAAVYDTVMSGRFVRPLPTWAAAGLVVAAAMLAAALAGWLGAAVAWAAVLAGMALYSAAAVYAWAGAVLWLPLLGPEMAMALSFVGVTIYRQLSEFRQRRAVTRTFKQYLSPAMVDQLVEDPHQAALGGRERLLTSLFADLQGFTGISERLGPERTVGLLNTYLDHVGEIVQVRFGGTLSKYEGDGVFVFFGAPLDQADQAQRALSAALAWQGMMREFNLDLQRCRLLPEGVLLEARIGIATGNVFVGNMGSSQRVAYTAIGDAVNLASRLESANKQLGSRILVDESCWAAGGAEMLGRPMGKLIVMGRQEPVATWQPLCPHKQAGPELLVLAEEFAKAIARFAAAEFAPAGEIFEAINARQADPPAAFYANICRRYAQQPPEDFDGSLRLESK